MKRLLGITALVLGYIYLLTILFEYTVNKASSTLLTTTGIILILVLTVVITALIYKLFKKEPK